MLEIILKILLALSRDPQSQQQVGNFFHVSSPVSGTILIDKPEPIRMSLRASG